MASSRHGFLGEGMQVSRWDMLVRTLVVLRTSYHVVIVVVVYKVRVRSVCFRTRNEGGERRREVCAESRS